MIVTASWFTPLPEGYVRVGISRGVPAGYRLYRRLAPGPWFNSVPTEEVLRRYDAEILAPLDPRQVLDELLRLAGDKVPVLCCFERVDGGQWCHLAPDWRIVRQRLAAAVAVHGVTASAFVF